MTETVAEEEVEVRSLDSIIGECLAGIEEPRIFLKTDTQGWDLEVMRGARKTLPRILALQTELPVQPLYEGIPLYSETMRYLEQQGFGVTGMFSVLRDESLRLIEFDCVMTRGALGSEGGAPPFDREQFEARLRELDPDLFGYVDSETSVRDRLSLLALHNACRDLHGRYRYLEIGSHLGGSLQVPVADARCTAITSIDPRPASVPDDARGEVPYPENSTERMLELLSGVPGANLSKVRTIEASTADLSPSEVEGAEFCFIDGEHTYEAALRDARFCREVLGGEGVIAFHDSGLVGEAIEEFVSELEDGSFSSGPAPGVIHVVELGPPRVTSSGWLLELMEAPQTGVMLYKPGPSANWCVSFSPHGQVNKSGDSYEIYDLSARAPAALSGTWRVTRLSSEVIELDDGPGAVPASSAIPDPGLGPYTCSARLRSASPKESVR